MIGLGVPIIRGFVSSLERHGRPLLASYASGVIETQRVVLATGIMDKQTRLAEWVDAVRRGELRYCSICDAFEAIGRKIAVVGPFGHAIGKALFMRVYSAEVILVPADDVRDEAGVQQLADAAVQVAPCLVALQRKEGGHRGGVGRRHPRAFRHRLSRDGGRCPLRARGSTRGEPYVGRVPEG